jgi:hypothetical protein
MAPSFQEATGSALATTSRATANSMLEDLTRYDPFYWLGSCLLESASSSAAAVAAAAGTFPCGPTCSSNNRLRDRPEDDGDDRRRPRQLHNGGDAGAGYDEADLAAAVARVLGEVRQAQKQKTTSPDPPSRPSTLQQSLEDIGMTACCLPNAFAPRRPPQTSSSTYAEGTDPRYGNLKDATSSSRSLVWPTYTPGLELESLAHHRPHREDASSSPARRSSSFAETGPGGPRPSEDGADASGAAAPPPLDDDVSVRTDMQSVCSFLMVSMPHVREQDRYQQQPSGRSGSFSASSRPGCGSSLWDGTNGSAGHTGRGGYVNGSPYRPQHHRKQHQQHQRQPAAQEPDPPSDPEDVGDYVLSPSLMRQLQRSFPASKRGDSFWLQYSLVRDGASLDTLLDRVVGHSRHSVLAIETVGGEVFGAFLAHPWQRSADWYGGGESFLWTTTIEASPTATRTATPPSKTTTGGGGVSPPTEPMTELGVRRRRTVPLENLAEAGTEEEDVADATTASSGRHESGAGGTDSAGPDGRRRERRRLEVFPYSFVENPYIQLCRWDRLVLGGGTGDEEDCHHGFGLALDGDLMSGRTHPCRTFHSPSLSRRHADGSPFEIRNVEVWNLTPCLTMVESKGRRVVHRSGRHGRTGHRR